MSRIVRNEAEEAELSPSLIVPRIKHANFLAAMSEIVHEDEDAPVVEPLVGDLLITYAFDLPTAFRMMRAQDLSQLGITLAELRLIAIHNLKKQLGEIEVQGDPPLVNVVVGNNHEACLLLVDELWESLADDIPPEIVVGVPTRDVVLVTTTASTKGGLELLRQATRTAHERESTHALSLNLMVQRKGKWEVFEEAT